MADEDLLKGVRRLEWARTHMGLLREVRRKLKKERVFEGLRVGMALHVEAKTGILALTIREAGAKVRLASCNPLSTDDSVSLALKEEFGLEVFARKWESREEYYGNLNSVLDLEPDFLIDDGGDLIFLVHTERKELLDSVKGANEETTTGIIRLRAMASSGDLMFPVISINDAHMKYLFDNRYGTGQSTMDGIMTSTNLLIAGKRFVVAGYGWCGRGIAMRARGMGAHVIVTEVDAVRAVEAKMDGFQVMPMMEAAGNADFIVSATGCKDVFTSEHIDAVKDGCILANAGHFDNEISKDALVKASKGIEKVREFVDRYDLSNGKSVYLLGEGRLINLVAGQGHPVEIMDMSFSLQALALRYLSQNHQSLENRVYDVAREIDEEVANMKLETLGVRIDKLTESQRRYLTDWTSGT
ncbi:MAG: adenosylhomocysteinase [Thermoplasmata archaeon]